MNDEVTRAGKGFTLWANVDRYRDVVVLRRVLLGGRPSLCDRLWRLYRAAGGGCEQ